MDGHGADAGLQAKERTGTDWKVQVLTGLEGTGLDLTGRYRSGIVFADKNRYYMKQRSVVTTRPPLINFYFK